MTPFILTPDLFARVSALLAETAGLHFDAGKLNTLQAHLRERARVTHSPSLDAYWALLGDGQAGQDERSKLVEAVTIHETSFFRNHEHFRALRSDVLPRLGRMRARERRLRIWSAGCATGEEAYSLAITCLEQPELAGWAIEIEATDISERVLTLARHGTYRAPALRYVEPAQVARWFTREEPPTMPTSARPTVAVGVAGGHDAYRVTDEVRGLVHFSRLNLAGFPYPRHFTDFDLILCENVVIYFHPDVTRRVIAAFYEGLNPGGFLFVGYSETLWQISDRFRLITAPHTFYYQRPDQEPGSVEPRAALTSRVLQGGVPPGDRLLPPAPTPARSPGGTRKSLTHPRPHPALAPVPDADPSREIAVAERRTHEGHAHMEAGRYEEAQTAFADALIRNPSAVGALVGLAQIHANQGRLVEAEAECRRALDVDVLSEDAHLLLALIYRQQDRTGAAIDHFEKVLYINVESIAGHFHLAELYRGQQRDVEAARQYRRALWALDRHPADGTVSGLPAGMVRRVCEAQLRRLKGTNST